MYTITVNCDLNGYLLDMMYVIYHIFSPEFPNRNLEAGKDKGKIVTRKNGLHSELEEGDDNGGK